MFALLSIEGSLCPLPSMLGACLTGLFSHHQLPAVSKAHPLLAIPWLELLPAKLVL